MRRYCPECGETSIWEKVRRTEEFAIEDETMDIEVELLICKRCGAEYDDMNSPYDPYLLAQGEFRRRKAEK